MSKLHALQDLVSSCVAGLNPAITHNLEKYYVLKKVHYLSAIEEVEGDYLEFGVFTGSSFCHSMRCVRGLTKLREGVRNTRFYGFDSFAGFGELSADDTHPFYVDENFATSLAQVERRARRAAGKLSFQLVPGFFDESLRPGPAHYGIERARIVFLDSDTYASARAALTFCLPTVQPGTLFVLDDYFSYRGARERGVARAFAEFVDEARLDVRTVFTYGMGGIVYIVASRGAAERGRTNSVRDGAHMLVAEEDRHHGALNGSAPVD